MGADIRHAKVAWAVAIGRSQRLARLLAFRAGDFTARGPAVSHRIVREKPDLVCGEIERFASPARA